MTKASNSTSPEALRGSVKEAIGKLTGNDRVEAEGRRQKREADKSKADESKADGSKADGSKTDEPSAD